MNITSLATRRDGSIAGWALAFLFGAMIVAVGVVTAGHASDDSLRGPTHFIAMMVLMGAFGGSATLLGRIARSQEPNLRRVRRMCVATCVITAAAFVLAFGIKGGIAPSILALVAAALTLAALWLNKLSHR